MAQTVEELEAQKAQREAEAQANAEQAAKEAADKAAKEGATAADVTAAVEKARREEKDKLYPQIEALKTSIEEMREVMREERAEKERIKREAEEKAEKARQAKMTDEQRQTEVLSRLEEQLKEERLAREAFAKKLEERDRKEELSKYRNALLQAAGDEIIPDLVVGNTKEELDRSFEIAKARYAEFATKFKTANADRIRGGMPRSTNPDLGAQEELELDESLTRVDTNRYKTDAAYRDKITREVELAYAKASGRR